jgi:defect-in-organelle-trafficking protein DotC
MPRKTAFANFRSGRTVLLTGLSAVGLCVIAGHAHAQQAPQSATPQQQQQITPMAQINSYQPIQQTGNYVAGAMGGQIVGYDPQTGAPIYQQTQNGETPKKRQVLYEDLEQDTAGTDTLPPDLKSLQTIERENTLIDGQQTGMPMDIRRDALREAAISFGARGGLAWRTFAIRRELETRATALDSVYDFRQLLIPAPSGLLIEPPIINESLNAMLIEGDGQQAAVSDRIYNIVNNAKIVSTARTWRNYLEREWGAVEPPPDILRPENEEERKIWVELVAKGWEEGVRQANEIFQDDLNLMMADFQGMVRYRVLLTQGMVSPPYALQVDRGVTGDGNEMRIGDRAVQITGVPELITGSEQWQPANR